MGVLLLVNGGFMLVSSLISLLSNDGFVKEITTSSFIVLLIGFVFLFFGIFVMWFLAFYMGFSQPISSKKLEQTFKNYFK